jgi:hypothetical protein
MFQCFRAYWICHLQDDHEVEVESEPIYIGINNGGRRRVYGMEEPVLEHGTIKCDGAL